MAARYRKGLELQALGRDLARLERICRTAETAATIKCVMLRLIACRRRCRVIRPCAMDTQDGQVDPKATSDLRSWKGTQIYAHGTLYHRPPQTPFEMRYAVRCVTP